MGSYFETDCYINRKYIELIKQFNFFYFDGLSYQCKDRIEKRISLLLSILNSEKKTLT